jgi:hypothetical protein
MHGGKGRGRPWLFLMVESLRPFISMKNSWLRFVGYVDQKFNGASIGSGHTDV